MLIEFDIDKRNKTLAERGLDFARVGDVFTGQALSWVDNRLDYGEPRCVTFGVLNTRFVVVVWTPRGAVRRIISMRYANEREIAKHAQSLG